MTIKKLITISLLAVLLFSSPTFAQKAAEPKIAIYYVENSSAPNGFEEKFRWNINSESEWNRFEAFTSRFAPAKEKFSPFTSESSKRPKNMIVITAQNKNLGIGRDYYLTPQGIMIAERVPQYRFFEDNKNMFGFLKEQQKHFLNFKNSGTEKPKTGLEITYEITNQLSNPSWFITKPEDILIYYDFLKGNRERQTNSQTIISLNQPFLGKDYFTIKILDEKRDYDFINVTEGVLRFGKSRTQFRYVVDEKKYYEFYLKRAIELMRNKINTNRLDQTNKKDQF